MKDKLTQRAKRQGYRARSVYKFFTLNKRYSLVKKRDKVLDLGCWPGSWIQALLRLDCFVVGVDIIQIKPLEDMIFIKGSVTTKNTQSKIKKYSPYEAVISDLAPKTTGIREIDQQKSLELSLTALDIAIKNLRKNGNFLCKIFESPDTKELLKKAKKYFHSAKFTKPTSSKKRSKEIYLVCKSFK